MTLEIVSRMLVRCCSHDSRRVLAYFCFDDSATTEIYTLSLHDALPILTRPNSLIDSPRRCKPKPSRARHPKIKGRVERKSTKRKCRFFSAIFGHTPSGEKII